jgi:septum site-determining protein MinD
MARIICISSGKGGVGKTTITANLASALSKLGQGVIAVDANLTTSNLGLHLGIPMYPVTLQDVINENARIKDALYYHDSGFRILPADVSISKVMTPESSELLEVFYKIADVDFLIIDSAAGLGKEALSAVEASDEVLIVTNPEMPALTDAVKIINFAEMYGTITSGVIVNRVRDDKYEVPLNDVEGFMDLPIIGLIPEDKHMKKALAYREPIVDLKPYSKAARELMMTAARIADVPYTPRKRFGLF